MFWYDNWYDGLVIVAVHGGTMLPEVNSWIWNVTFIKYDMFNILKTR